MSAAEHDLLNRIRLNASRQGARLFRNNVGQGWVGRLVHKAAGRVVLENARPLHAGLCTGSSDLIGWTPVVVTADMIGQTLAVFTAVEAKTGRVQVTDDQRRFLAAVEKAGGIARVDRLAGA